MLNCVKLKVRHARAISRNGIQSEKRLRRDNRPAISGLHPTARERHGREQQSAIALKLIFGYLKCRPTKIVVKKHKRGGDSLLGTKGVGGNC